MDLEVVEDGLWGRGEEKGRASSLFLFDFSDLREEKWSDSLDWTAGSSSITESTFLMSREDPCPMRESP